MNPIGALASLLAVVVFPGAAFAGLVSLLARWAGRLPAGATPASPEAWAAALAMVASCGLLALPGSPLFDLSAGTSLAPLLLVVPVGLAWTSAETWPRHRRLAAASILLPLLALAAGAGTFDARIIAGATPETARIAAAVATGLALPSLVRPFDPAAPRPGRAALLGALSLVAVSLVAYAPLAGLVPVLGAGICALAAVAYAGLLGALRSRVLPAQPVLAALALIPAGIAIVVALA